MIASARSWAMSRSSSSSNWRMRLTAMMGTPLDGLKILYAINNWSFLINSCLFVTVPYLDGPLVGSFSSFLRAVGADPVAVPVAVHGRGPGVVSRVVGEALHARMAVPADPVAPARLADRDDA